MQCLFIINQVRNKLNDPDKVTWGDSYLIGVLNEALHALVTYRPDAASKTATILLSPGTKQSLPEDGVRLIKCIRNKGINGASDAGRAISVGDMLTMDSVMPDWHLSLGQTTVEEYFYDPLVPRDFYVYPPVAVHPTIGIEVSYVCILPTITGTSDTLPVDEYFGSAIQEWMLYSLFGGDDDQSPNFSVAQSHARMFFELLKVKVASDAAINPKAVKSQQ